MECITALRGAQFRTAPYCAAPRCGAARYIALPGDAPLVITQHYSVMRRTARGAGRATAMRSGYTYYTAQWSIAGYRDALRHNASHDVVTRRSVLQVYAPQCHAMQHGAAKCNATRHWQPHVIATGCDTTDCYAPLGMLYTACIAPLERKATIPVGHVIAARAPQPPLDMGVGGNSE